MKKFDWSEAEAHLEKVDPKLGRIIAENGCSQLKRSRGGFEFLARSIVFQQLSLKAAATIFGRLTAACGGKLTADSVAMLTDTQFRSAGVSRQKANYLRDLARHSLDKTLPIAKLSRWPDERVREALTQVKGIGVWTADMYLMFVLNRPDVLPSLDQGIRIAIQLLYKTPVQKIDWERLRRRWSPYCTIACWHLWHYKGRMKQQKRRQA